MSLQINKASSLYSSGSISKLRVIVNREPHR